MSHTPDVRPVGHVGPVLGEIGVGSADGVHLIVVLHVGEVVQLDEERYVPGCLDELDVARLEEQLLTCHS